MVKHGRSKKRRSGRTGRTKLKNRNYRKFKPPQIMDMVVKSKWDPTKSPTVNMSNLGLQSNLNDKVVKPHSASLLPPPLPPTIAAAETRNDSDISKEEKGASAIELFDIPESDNFASTTTIIPGKTKRMRMLPVSIEDQQFIIKCIDKYGIDEDSYTKMARDIKVNDMQYTKSKLKKMVARFLLLEEHQLRVEVKEEIKQMMRGGGKKN